MSHFPPPRRGARIASPLLLALTLLPLAPRLRAGPAGQTPRVPSRSPRAAPSRASPTAEAKLAGGIQGAAGASSVTLFAGPPVAMYPTCVGESPRRRGVRLRRPEPLALDAQGRRARHAPRRHRRRRPRRHVHDVRRDGQPARRRVGRQDGVRHAPAEPHRVPRHERRRHRRRVDRCSSRASASTSTSAAPTTRRTASSLGPTAGSTSPSATTASSRRPAPTDGRLQQRGGGVVRVRPDGTDLEIVERRHAQHLRRRDRSVRATSSRATTRTTATAGTCACTTSRRARHGLPVALQELRRPSTSRRSPTTAAAPAWARCGSRIRRGPRDSNDACTPATGRRSASIATRSRRRARSTRRRRKSSSACCGRPISRSTATPTCTSRASPADSSPTTRDTVGYVVRVRPSAATAAREPNVSRATDAALLRQLASGNSVQRVHAQQELLRRGEGRHRRRAAPRDRRREAPRRCARRGDLHAEADPGREGERGARERDQRRRPARSRDRAPRARRPHRPAPGRRAGAVREGARRHRPAGPGAGDPRPRAARCARSGRVRSSRSRRAPTRGSRTSPSTRSPRSARRTPRSRRSTTRRARRRAARAREDVRRPARSTRSSLVLGKATDADTRLAARAHARAVAQPRGPLARRLVDHQAGAPRPLLRSRPVGGEPANPRRRSPARSPPRAGDEFTALAGELALNQALPRGAGPLLAAVIASGDPLRTPLIKAMVGRAQLDAGTVAIAAQLDARSAARCTAPSPSCSPARAPLAPARSRWRAAPCSTPSSTRASAARCSRRSARRPARRRSTSPSTCFPG